VKRYGQLTAVDHVSIEVSKGEIFGLLGPNGAGKTTLLSMLVTMRKPTSGKATVNGLDVKTEPDSVRRSIGMVFQDPSLDEELTAYENLELHAALYGMPRKEREDRISEVMEMVELRDRLHEVVKTFSGGMRRRLEIARGLLHWPEVLFLDEPTLGLDPQTRNRIWEYIRKLRKEHGVTVVLTTHYMDEADMLCDRIAIIDHGRIIALGRTEDLKNSLGGDTIVAETNDAEKLCKAVHKFGCRSVRSHDGRVTLHVERGDRKIPELMKIAARNNIEILSVSLHKPTLDDVFLHYTGKTIREEETSPADAFRMRRRAMERRR